jgi:Zn-dependent protease
MAELSIDNLTVQFDTPSGPVTVVKSLSLQMGSERIGIVGESGSGKSMTARAIMGLIRAPGRVSADRMVFDGIDLFGTILFPLLLIVTRSPVMFGWARPVPINPMNFRHIKKDMALVGASGPASNLLLAIVAALFCRMSLPALGPFHILSRTLLFAVSINLMLAVFNLIPIPPLDGSRIVVGFLPDRAAARFLQIERYGFVLLFVLLFFGLFDTILFPVVGVLFRILVGS